MMSEWDIGQWDVDVDGDATTIVLHFTHFAESGVETFQTELPREQAVSLAVAILNAAMELPEDADAEPG